MASFLQQYSTLILIGIGLIAMLWFSNRSRQKMAAQQEERRKTLAEQLVPGAWVHTAVGFWGRFVDEDGDVIVLETSDGTEMYWDRQMIREVGVEPPFAADEDEELEEGESQTPILGMNDPETSTGASENK